jgi:hypothetical protein
VQQKKLFCVKAAGEQGPQVSGQEGKNLGVHGILLTDTPDTRPFCHLLYLKTGCSFRHPWELWSSRKLEPHRGGIQTQLDPA